ncbi:hypothetical protein H5410_056236 [Solanum commersonii]|uniref:Uncharacterized protein n=1 Tax=Solanum commersonii TaxID=4109 RepID=A0A9J5WMI6_SOLCO|nr:hypothetical protein H5410_056236 [Solanum commersonii]
MNACPLMSLIQISTIIYVKRSLILKIFLSKEGSDERFKAPFVAWFPNDVAAVVGLSIIGCTISFLQQVELLLIDCLFICFRNSESS